MTVHSYAELAEHVGHDVGVVTYGDVNAAVECNTCDEVLLDFDRQPEDPITLKELMTDCSNSGSYAGVRIFTDKSARTQCHVCGRQWLPEPWMDGGESPDYLPPHLVFDPDWVQPKVGTKQEAWV